MCSKVFKNWCFGLFIETYSRIGLLRSYGNLQSYWTTTKLWKLTVVLDYYELLNLIVLLDYYEAIETYGRIGLLRNLGNLQSYWTTTRLWKLTVVLDYYEAMETYSRIGLLRSLSLPMIDLIKSNISNLNEVCEKRFINFKIPGLNSLRSFRV